MKIWLQFQSYRSTESSQGHLLDLSSYDHSSMATCYSSVNSIWISGRNSDWMTRFRLNKTAYMWIKVHVLWLLWWFCILPHPRSYLSWIGTNGVSETRLTKIQEPLSHSSILWSLSLVIRYCPVFRDHKYHQSNSGKLSNNLT